MITVVFRKFSKFHKNPQKIVRYPPCGNPLIVFSDYTRPPPLGVPRTGRSPDRTHASAAPKGLTLSGARALTRGAVRVHADACRAYVTRNLVSLRLVTLEACASKRAKLTNKRLRNFRFMKSERVVPSRALPLPAHRAPPFISPVPFHGTNPWFFARRAAAAKSGLARAPRHLRRLLQPADALKFDTH